MSVFQNVDLSSFPAKLTSKNILSAIVDIVFDTNNLPQEVILGSLYASDIIRKNYYNPISTGINDIPKNARKADPNLRNAILFNFNHKESKFRIGCGDNIISLANLNFAYDTWDIFVKELDVILNVMNAFLQKKEKIGVRYINVFQENIIDNLNIELKVLNNKIINNNFSFTFEDTFENRKIISRISNGISYNFIDLANPTNKRIINNASAFDIDVVFTDKNKISANLKEEINISHNILKKVFFSTLKKDFINKLSI